VSWRRLCARPRATRPSDPTGVPAPPSGQLLREGNTGANARRPPHPRTARCSCPGGRYTECGYPARKARRSLRRPGQRAAYGNSDCMRDRTSTVRSPSRSYIACFPSADRTPRHTLRRATALPMGTADPSASADDHTDLARGSTSATRGRLHTVPLRNGRPDPEVHLLALSSRGQSGPLATAPPHPLCPDIWVYSCFGPALPRGPIPCSAHRPLMHLHETTKSRSQTARQSLSSAGWVE